MRSFLILAVLLMSCAVMPQEFNEWYYSGGNALIIDNYPHAWFEPVTIYLSENKIAFYYADPARNVVYDVDLIRHTPKSITYKMVGYNEKFEYNAAFGQLLSYKIGKDGPDMNNYRIFYNVKKYKPRARNPITKK